MLNVQLAYDAVKLIGFNTDLMQTMGAEMSFIQDLAHQGKICQRRLVAEKA
jgi:hypothetical protein